MPLWLPLTAVGGRQVLEEGKAHPYVGPSPTKAWTLACLASKSSGTRLRCVSVWPWVCVLSMWACTPMWRFRLFMACGCAPS